MANIKKVITHLVAEERIARVCKKDFASVDVDILSDAIELLKEQEAIEPGKENDGNPHPWTSWWYVCGNCGREIDYNDNFCRNCGRSVKWE